MTDSWKETVGPLYDIDEASHILCLSPEILREFVKRREALQLDYRRCPGWQFDLKRLTIYPALLEIMGVFSEKNLSSNLVASFCCTPQPELDQDLLVLPLDLFEEGGTPELVTAARRFGAQLDR